MPRGGKRPGAGRKQGAATKRTRAIADGLIDAGVTPLEVMLRAMREHYAEERWDEAAAVAKDCAPYMHPELFAKVGDGIDDPHSTETAESEAERQTTIRIFRESVPTRLINPASSAIVVIMQRLHAEDVAGTALALNLGYEHLMLPMEFEPDRRCHTSIGFKDPRTYDGELLFPERFPREVVDRDKAAMGSYAVAGQFQQRPTMREGGLFKRSWFKAVKAVPAGVRWVRYWDLAATADQMGAEPA